MSRFSFTFQYCNGGDLADYLNGELSSPPSRIRVIFLGRFPLNREKRNVTNPDPETEQRAVNYKTLGCPHT